MSRDQCNISEATLLTCSHICNIFEFLTFVRMYVPSRSMHLSKVRATQNDLEMISLQRNTQLWIGKIRVNFFHLVWRHLCDTEHCNINDLPILSWVRWSSWFVYILIEHHLFSNRDVHCPEKISRFSVAWYRRSMLSLFCLVLSLLAAARLMHGLVISVNEFRPFYPTY